MKKLDLQVLRYEGESRIKKDKSGGMLYFVIFIYAFTLTIAVIQFLSNN